MCKEVQIHSCRVQQGSFRAVQARTELDPAWRLFCPTIVRATNVNNPDNLNLDFSDVPCPKPGSNTHCLRRQSQRSANLQEKKARRKRKKQCAQNWATLAHLNEMRPLPLSLWLLVTAQIEAQEQGQAHDAHQLVPTAIRKMPADHGAKFHHEYCAFEDHPAFAAAPGSPHAAIAARSLYDADDSRRLWANASAELSLRPPFALVSGPESLAVDESKPPAWNLFGRAASALALLEKRQWA